MMWFFYTYCHGSMPSSSTISDKQLLDSHVANPSVQVLSYKCDYILIDWENVKFWASQAENFKNLCMLPRQHVQKNHIIDGPACRSTKDMMLTVQDSIHDCYLVMYVHIVAARRFGQKEVMRMWLPESHRVSLSYLYQITLNIGDPFE